jgi:NAD(P)-dependent dehydrogenase (short-subunit alcohol dehydrogenase family)
VTGAPSGIGRAVTGAMMRQGANVAALDIDRSGLETLGRPKGLRNLVTTRLDVSERAEVRAAVDRAEERFGSIDILCTCAAVDNPASLLSITEDEWHRTTITRRANCSRSRHFEGAQEADVV